MNPLVRTILAAAAVAWIAPPRACAQQEPPGPAPELKRLEPLVGHWHGRGVMHEPEAKTAWTARGTYAWCLDGHFLQEDFRIEFEGNDVPLVFRAYLGWDREQRRYVNAVVNNGGQVQLHPLHWLPDGTMLQTMLQNQEGVPYAERSRLKVDGDVMTHTIDLLLADGSSLQIIDGRFERTADGGFAGQFDASGWMGAKPADAVARLSRSAGRYAVEGHVVMGAGEPPMKITGADTFTPVFGGMVLHGHTEGEAEGMPGKYVGEVFWGHDAVRGCLTSVYLSNMGEVFTMDAWWGADGKLLSTSAGTWMGQPSVQRMVMEFAADGAAARAFSHTILGAGAPFQSFDATYTKQR